MVLASYWAYALVVVGLIEPEAEGRVARSGASVFEEASAEMSGLAEHFPPGTWPLDQPKILESRQARLLFGEYTKQGDYEVELRPCALVFAPDEPGLTPKERNRRAIVLDAPEGAVLRFDEPLDLGQAKVGRLVSGRLIGPVVIRSQGKSPGPEDDLRITTRDVVLTEKLVTTPHPVEFQWGPNRGRGEDLAIELAPDPKGGKHGPGVSGVKSLVVRRVERLQLEFPEKDVSGKAPSAPGLAAPPGKPSRPGTVQAEVTCRGPFRFDLDRKVATFSDHVDVWEIHPTGPSDHLSCELLSVFFTEKETPSAGASKPAPAKPAPQKAAPQKAANPANLAPQRIEATGKPVVVHAPSRGVQAAGERLEYNLQTGRIILDGGEEVVLKQGPNEIHARDVQYQPAGEGKLGQVLAHGPGWLAGHAADKPEDQVQARWNQQLQIRPQQDNQVISLTGGAEITYRGIGRLAAGEIHFWLAEAPAASEAETRPRLQPDRMMARQDVRLSHPQVDAAVNQLEVWFECVEPPSAARPPSPGPVAAVLGPPARALGRVGRALAAPAWDLRRTASGASRFVRLAMAQSGLGEGEQSRSPQSARWDSPPSPSPAPAAPVQRFDVVGDLLRAQVVMAGPKAELSELMIEGNVRLVEKQTAQPGERPMIVTGERIHVVDAGQPHAAVAVTGRAAHFEARGMALNGSNINLNRGTNRLWIDGPGWMTLPLDRDAQRPAGKTPDPLTPPRGASSPGPDSGSMVPSGTAPHSRPGADAGPLEVHWQERMDFDGLSARFDGSVVATSRLHHLRTDALEVTLSQRVEFAQTKRDTRPEVRRLACPGAAYLENRSFDAQGQASLDRVQVAGLTVDLMGGDIAAAGPGWFRSVRRGGAQAVAGRLGGLARAQAPPEQDAGASLVYTGVDFQRSLSGNLKRREMTFSDRVRTVYGPVDGWDAAIDPDKPEQAGPRGAVLTCDQLQVAEMQTPNQREWALELVATGNTLVESAAYTARASRLSYAEAKGLLILEGDGRADADLYCQERVGAEMQRFSARRIYYWPATNHWTIDSGSLLEVHRPGRGQ